MRLPIFDDLGIGSIEYDHILISFLPDRDKQGKKFSNKVWEIRALKLQAELFQEQLLIRGQFLRGDLTKLRKEKYLSKRPRPFFHTSRKKN